MIKTTKKATGQDIESVIATGKAEIKTSIKGSVGRPKNKVLKKLCTLYLPEDIVQAIDENCRGNKSFFAEEVFRYYFDAHNIEY